MGELFWKVVASMNIPQFMISTSFVHPSFVATNLCKTRI